MKNRIFYGLGVVGSTISQTFIGSFLTLYATDVLGLDALFFASLLIVPKVLDIVIDFFIGYFVGKTKTRFGMYRPWLFNMAGMVVSLVTIFSVPYFDASDSVGLSILVIAYFLYDGFFGSLYWIPYVAMAGAITEDANELVKLSSSRTVFDYGFSTLVSVGTMLILLLFGGHKNPEGWLIVALVFGAVSLISSALCFIFVRTNLGLEKKLTRDYSFADVFKDYKEVIRNRGFITVSVLIFMIYVATYTYNAVSYYFYIYNLGIEDKISYLMFIGSAAVILVSLMAGKVQERLGYKASLLLGAGFMIASSLFMMVTYTFTMMIFSGILLVTGSTILIIMMESLRPVVALNLDADRVKTPLNSTIGLTAVVEGVATILGNTLGAAIVSRSKYDASLSVQDDFTLNVIRYCSPVFTILMSIAIIVVVLNFRRKNED